MPNSSIGLLSMGFVLFFGRLVLCEFVSSSIRWAGTSRDCEESAATWFIELLIVGKKKKEFTKNKRENWEL